MQRDFHYYATYVAALLAGYGHEECLEICYSDQLVDHFTQAFIDRIGAPKASATTQSSADLANARTDPMGRQDITRIWASFHFLPGNLRADPGKGGRRYRERYALICNPNGQLVADIVELARGESLQHVGIAMHTLADTWAHRYFAGTPSLVINNMSRAPVELVEDAGADEGYREVPINFRTSAGKDDLERGSYVNSPFSSRETSIFNLGHGRCGHLPDYSFARYRYMPAWGDYGEVVKDNPHEYYQAFCQVVYALRYLRGDRARFELDRYDYDVVAPYGDRIRQILSRRQLSAVDDWRALGEELSGRTVVDYEADRYVDEYVGASRGGKDETFLGRFVLGALAQKSLVTNRIYTSGNRLAGRSIEYDGRFAGMVDYIGLLDHWGRGDE